MNYYENKDVVLNTMRDNMLNKTLAMFQYENLPDTLCRVTLEKQLQMFGYSFITEVNGELYSFTGSLGGQLDMYHRPTEIIITNEYLKLNKTFKLTDGVLIKNDDLMKGLRDIYDKGNAMLLETEISMLVQLYISRMPMLITSGDDATTESAKHFLNDIINGKLGVIAENRFLDGIKTQHTSTTGNINFTQMIELQQYLKANLLHDVGLNANFNMKRERLNTSEVEMNNDVLLPLVDNMLLNRINAIEKLNDKYNLNIVVSLGSSWSRNDDENESEIEHDLLPGVGTENELSVSIENEENKEGDNDEI